MPDPRHSLFKDLPDPVPDGDVVMGLAIRSGVIHIASTPLSRTDEVSIAETLLDLTVVRFRACGCNNCIRMLPHLELARAGFEAAWVALDATDPVPPAPTVASIGRA